MDLSTLCQAANPWYYFQAQLRPYHNRCHAEQVVQRLKLMTTPSDQLILAATWHDAVYVPGAVGDANEQCSAAALLQTARSYTSAADQLIINNAALLIKYTSIEFHMHERPLTGELAYLLDADLGGLASEYSKFEHNQDLIILEQGGDVSTDRQKVARFLDQLLNCREFIYHTQYGRDNWEAVAQSNINQYCTTYGAFDEDHPRCSQDD